jgi:protein-L-isoaspartate(D-aspartate) O-methyltransferase
MSWAVWITGPSGSGKSAAARAVAEALRTGGEHVHVLELDAIRRVLTPAATYSDSEREAVHRSLVYIGASLVDAGIPVIFDATAHRRAWRDFARATLPRYAEVQLLCPLDVCRQREAARAGARVPGVNVEYEFALAPELQVDTAVQNVGAVAAAIVEMIDKRFLSEGAGATAPATARDLDRASVLVENTDEQRKMSRRARRYAAAVLRDEIIGRRQRRSLVDQRERMVELQIVRRGVRDPAVLAAMRQVPRELFVAFDRAHRAYDDTPLPIGEGQTISQPYIVAAMTEALWLRPTDRVLEIGTGSGYAAAVLAVIAAEVYTIERLERLAESARHRLEELGFSNVHVRHGDGSLGWPEHAPYDAIVVTAGGPDVPRSLLQQLAVGGRLVMPVGPTTRSQQLVRVIRSGKNEYDREHLEDVAFVPLIGAEGWRADEASG